MKNLEIIKRDKLTETTTKQGKLLHELLQNYFANHPLVGEIRGQGLIGAIELVANKETPKPFDPALKVAPQMARRSMELGVLTRALPASDTLSFSPPFIVTDSELEVIVKTVHQAVNEIGKELGLYS